MKTQNTLLALALFIITTISLTAQTLNPTVSITAAGTANTFKGGYTFAYSTSGAPWNGSLISFGGFSNSYDTQLNADYGPNGGDHISFRTRNGDVAAGLGVWNPWIELATKKENIFVGDQTITNYSPTLILQRNNATGGYTQGIQTKLQDGTNNWFFGNVQPTDWRVSKGDYSKPLMLVTSTGNVGIGTANPSGKLDVFGAAVNPTNLILSADYIDRYRWRFNTFDRGAAIDLDFTASDSNDNQEAVLKLTRSTSGRPEFQLYNNALVANDGKVGIGTANPDEKLTVKGKIHAEEVRIDLLVPADYVFQKYYTGNSSLKADYVMPTLDQVAQYTKINNHLPSIPSAEEMKKNGVELGEMNNLLLQKIEELTLYAIEQQKKLEAQNKQLELLSERLSKVEKK
jgi:hypothetical protein